MTFRDRETSRIVGERLYLLRRHKCWSRTHVAAIAGTNPKTILRIEDGETAITVDMLMMFCRIYRVAPHRLFEGLEWMPVSFPRDQAV